jgi:hypothetical protein
LKTTLTTLLLLLSLGCISVNSDREKSKYPPRPEDAPVQVVCSSDAPTWAIDTMGVWERPPEGLEVAEFDVTFAKIREWDEVLEELKVRARELGGDIVIIDGGTNDLTNRTFTARVRLSFP